MTPHVLKDILHQRGEKSMCFLQVLACFQVGQSLTNMLGFLVPGPLVRLCVGLACVLSLWNTGRSGWSSRNTCSIYYVWVFIVFRERQWSVFPSRTLNEFDQNSNNKFPKSGFVPWLFMFESYLCDRIIFTSTVRVLVQTIVFSLLDH